MDTYKCPNCGCIDDFAIKFRIGEIEQYLDFDLYVCFKGDLKDIFFSPVITLTEITCHKCKHKGNPDTFIVKSYDN